MDSIKLWRVSVDRGSTICYQIWPGFVKGDGTRAPPQCKNLVAIATFRQFFPAWTTQYIYPDEIKPVNIDHWPTVACQSWPRDREFAHDAGFAAARRCLRFLVYGRPYVIGQTIYIFILFLSSIFFISSPNLSGRTLGVCHTSTHGVALVRI